MYYNYIFIVFIAFKILINAYFHLPIRKLNSYSLSNIKLNALREFEYGEIELIKFLGRINMVKHNIDKISDNNDDNVATTIRLFEARVVSHPPKMGERGQRVYVKEYSANGVKYGNKERKAIIKILKHEREKKEEKEAKQLMEVEIQSEEKEINNTNIKSSSSLSSSSLPFSYTIPISPVPQLLGILKVDNRVDDPQFQTQWFRKFPRLQVPQENFMVLVYNWDEATFRTLSRFPKLPQIIQGFEYFSDERRIKRRYNFIIKMIQKILLVISKIHNSGYCHGALTSESIWLTTSNQSTLTKLKLSSDVWYSGKVV